MKIFHKLGLISIFFIAGFAKARTPDLMNSQVGKSCPAALPKALVPAADQRLLFKRSASGVQIYVCNAKADGSTAWLFIAPQARLFNGRGKLDGTHFIGPEWQGNDGSAVKGQKIDEATVDSAALPWLLLKSAENKGHGLFESVTSIQRLNTVGGLAPDATACTTATLGTISQVAYTADYYFYDTHKPAEGTVNVQCR